jgi:Tfp pilus assembly protein PilN
MQDIDFLPLEYRQQHQRRQVQPWRVVVVAAFVALLAGAALAQHTRRQYVAGQLAAVRPQYEEALRQEGSRAELQAELQSAQCGAELLTYLRHPWPRTQLLAAALAPLPPEITLQQLHIARETPGHQPATEQRSRADKKAEEEKIAKLPPAARDLKRLREEFDRTQVTVRLTGTTTDSAALHRYLGVLGKQELFAKAELRSIERVEGNQAGSLRFHATLTARPGYGQPGGPAKAEKRGGSKPPAGRDDVAREASSPRSLQP